MPTVHSKSTPSRPVAIVTGGSRGIGAEISQQLSDGGFAVVINYSNNASDAELLAEELNASNGHSLAIKADISNSDDVKRLFDLTEETLGRVDVLINSAGVLNTLPLADHSDELFDQTFAINTRGTFNTLRQAASRMNDGGNIINLSSSAVGLNLPGYAVYAASKAAVETLTKVFAKELRGRGITVNAIAPGPVATDLFLEGKTEEQIQGFAKMAPLERLGTPEDIASIASFLVGPSARWVNGQILRANGGVI